MAWGALIGLGASLLGSALGSRSEKKAQKRRVQAQKEAIGTMEKYLSPYSQVGLDNLGLLQDFVQQGGNFADTQAFKDITNSARAGGQLGSGNRATALADYYATNYRPQRFNELTFLPTMGARAAGDLAHGIGGIQQNIGDIRATGTVGSSNAISSGLGGIASFASLLDRKNLSGFNDSVGYKRS